MLAFAVKTKENVVFRVRKPDGKFVWTMLRLESVESTSCVVSMGKVGYRIHRDGKPLELNWKGCPINVYFIAPRGSNAQMGFEAPECVGIQRDSFIGPLRG